MGVKLKVVEVSCSVSTTPQTSTFLQPPNALPTPLYLLRYLNHNIDRHWLFLLPRWCYSQLLPSMISIRDETKIYRPCSG